MKSPPIIHSLTSRTLSGHSERRTLFHETSAFVAQKTKAALSAGLRVILCVGETLSEREAGKTDDVVREQLGEVVKELGSDVNAWG
jgi:triosephosphate isomerase